MSELVKVEYRVRQKTVFFVTRYCDFGGAVSLTEEGEFTDAIMAQRAAKALCVAETKFQGIAEDDPRVVYPELLEYSSIPS